MSESRRPPGAGSLDVRLDGAGRESWYGRWTIGGVRVKRCLGPKRLPSTREGLTRAQAERELRRRMTEEQAPKEPGERLAMGDVSRRYLKHLEARGRKRATVVGVEMALRVHLIPFFADQRLDKIRSTDVEELIVLMQRRGLSAKSIRTYVGTLSAIFNYAVAPQRRWAAHNPVSGVELPPKQDRDDIRFLDPDEVLLLADAVPEGPYRPIDRALYTTAAMTGLRQGELIALRWRDVDWPASRIRVRQNYVLGQFGTPKSRRSTRSVPMADRVAGELDRLYRAAGDPGDDDLVFADPFSAGPLSKPAILRRFRRALAAAGLDTTRRFHDLRHTFGTAVAAAGVPMRTLQEWMGHRDLATTQIYADYSPSAREAGYIQSAFGTIGEAGPPLAGMCPSGSLDLALGAGEELAGRDSESVGELDDGGHPHVAETTLGPTHLDGCMPQRSARVSCVDAETLAVDADVAADLHLGLHGGDPGP